MAAAGLCTSAASGLGSLSSPRRTIQGALLCAAAAAAGGEAGAPRIAAAAAAAAAATAPAAAAAAAAGEDAADGVAVLPWWKECRGLLERPEEGGENCAAGWDCTQRAEEKEGGSGAGGGEGWGCEVPEGVSSARPWLSSVTRKVPV